MCVVFPDCALREDRDQGCHPLLAAGWLANCLVMILDGPEMAPLQTFLFPLSAPGPGDWVFAGDLHNLKFCGNWAAFLTKGTE